MGKYTLLGQTIEFEECNERFFDIQYRLWQATEAAVAEFNAWYDSRGDILSVLKGYEQKAGELIANLASKKLFADLTTLELYDISQDRYIDECLICDNSGDAFDKIVDAYNSIVAQQEAEAEYRAERKANRGRVVGGGFGVGGALKGMATAGAMNAISGAGHGLVNAIGNIGSSIEAASAKRELYNNNSAKALLRSGICDDILACFNAHIHLINQRKNRYYISSFDSDKAGALFQNAKTVHEKQTELLLESFKNCPWNEDLLVYLFLTYKDDRKNIWDIAKRFHVDLYKTAEEAFSALYTTAAQNSEEKAQAVRKDILAQMRLLGITVSGTIDRIEKDGVKRLFTEYNTANEEQRQEMFAAVDAYDASERNKATVIHEIGVWEIAKKYRVSFSEDEIETILHKVYTEDAKKDEAKAQVAKKKIITIMQALAVKDSKTFNELESDCLARLCMSHQTANEATCNEMLKEIKAYDALDKNKQPYIAKIKSRIEAIWSAEDGEIFDNLYLNTDIENPEAVKAAITYVKEKMRTASANKYLSALNGCTAENIKKARQFQKSSTKLAMYVGILLVALGVVFLFVDLGFLLSMAIAAIGVVLLVYRYSLKKVWDLLTLGGVLAHSKILINGQAQHISESKAIVKVEKEIAESDKNSGNQ